MSTNFLICLSVIFGLAAIGAPVALSMIVGATVYLLVDGRDLSLAAEQMIQGIFNSFIVWPFRSSSSRPT